MMWKSYSEFMEELYSGSVNTVRYHSRNNAESHLECSPTSGAPYKVHLPCAPSQSMVAEWAAQNVQFFIVNPNPPALWRHVLSDIWTSIRIYFIFSISLLVLITFCATLYGICVVRTSSSQEITEILEGSISIEDTQAKPARFEDIFGCDQAKEEIYEFVEYLKNPEPFKKVGARPPTGILLSGDPGTGKTMLARALATEVGIPCYALSGSDFDEVFIGSGARKLRALFAQARQRSPCIIFIDEIDTVGQRRSDRETTMHTQTINQLLTELDGIKGKESIFFIGATNRANVLDPALRRPGRLDRTITLINPDRKARQDILNAQIQENRVPLAPDVNLEELAKLTTQCTGSDLTMLVNEAAISASRHKNVCVSMKDFHEAYLRHKGGVLSKPGVSQAALECLALDQAAQVLTGWALLSVPDRPQFSTILSSNQKGFTHVVVDDYQTGSLERACLSGFISIRLAGREALKLCNFPESHDARTLDSIAGAKALTCRYIRYGFSQLGPYFPDFQPDMNGYSHFKSPQFSPKQGMLLEKEVERLLHLFTQKTRELLKANLGTLKALQAELLEKETLTKEDFEGFFRQHPILQPEAPTDGRTEKSLDPTAGGVPGFSAVSLGL